MADINAAIDFVLRQEDETLSGVIISDPRDLGGVTRFGVAQRFHRNLTSTGFFSTMPVADALVTARQIYTYEYVRPLQLEKFVSQAVANAMLSFAVNEGVKTAVRELQKTIGLTTDGIFGPVTLVNVNLKTPSVLLSSLCTTQLIYYIHIVQVNPQLEVFLKGWTNRVRADCLYQV